MDTTVLLRFDVVFLFYCLSMTQAGELTNYTLTFETCNITNAGTEDDVEIVLYGSMGANITQRFHGSAGMFGRGSSYSKAIQHTDVGHVCKMSVYRRRRDSDNWKLKTLTVLYPNDQAVFWVTSCSLADESEDRDVSGRVYTRIDVHTVTSPWANWSSCDCVNGLRHRRRYNLCVKNDISLDNETCTSPQCNHTQAFLFHKLHLVTIVVVVCLAVAVFFWILLSGGVVYIRFVGKSRKSGSDDQAEEPGQSGGSEGCDLAELPYENI